MTSIFGRRSGTAMAVLVGAGMVLAARDAAAQSNREGVKLEIGVAGGVHLFAHDLELGVADAEAAGQPPLPTPKNSAVFGLRIGLVLHPMFVIEGEAMFMPTSARGNGESAFIGGFRGKLVYNIAPGMILDGRLVPFVLAGAGVTSVLQTGGTGQYNEIKSDTDPSYFGGAGVKYGFNDIVQLRLDALVLAAPNQKTNGVSADWEFTAGLGFTIGGHPPAAAPAPTATLVKDTDGDGIPDDQDKCPDKAGPRENGGCPDKDTDGDGIIDRKDKCPDKAGPPERDGCPEEDRDHDGIVDSKDKCPDEAEDKDGFEDEDGCPDPDNDKDGIPDVKDKCPNEPETKNGYQDEDGCPDEVPAPVKQFTGVVKGINFRRNSADIKASSFPLLKQAVSVFKNYPALRVEISGHTSTEGKRDFNMKLSRKRAEAVKLFLVSAGIDESRVGTVGYGPDHPIADNDTKEGQEKNRRIEFRLLGAEEKILNQPEPTDINPSPDRKARGKAGPTPKTKTPAKPAKPGKPAKATKTETPAKTAKPVKAEKPKTAAAAKPAKPAKAAKPGKSKSEKKQEEDEPP